MNRIITTLFCFSLLITLPAHAQNREYQSGVHYTTLAKPKAPADLTAAPAQEAKPAPLSASTDSKAEPEPEPDSATRIWNKYKDLATGTAGEKQKNVANEKPDVPQKPEAPEKPSASSTSTPPPTEERAQNAFQSIIDGWKQTNETRRDMRSLSFKTPEAPAKSSTETP